MVKKVRIDRFLDEDERLDEIFTIQRAKKLSSTTVKAVYVEKIWIFLLN
jgi:hypothetical protein